MKLATLHKESFIYIVYTLLVAMKVFTNVQNSVIELALKKSDV